MTFFNIFSKEKIKTPSPKPKIIIDNREKPSKVPSLLSNHLEIEFKQLPVGDYIVGNTAIERKTSQDLISSIINKRIISQLIELKQYPNQLLIVEGSLNLKDRNFSPNALKGFLLSVALDFKIPIIFTSSPEETADYIRILSNKSKKEHSIRASKIFKSKKEQVQHILEGFPNVGPKKIKALLQKFKSLKNIFTAEEKELLPILHSRTKDFLNLLN